MSYLQHPHIIEMIREGALESASEVQLDAAKQAAYAVPWHRVGTRVEWEQLGTKIDVHLDDPLSALEDTVLGRHAKLLFMFNEKSGVVGAKATVWSRMDEIARRAPGQRFVFGVTEDGTLDPEAIGMFSEGNDFVVATLRDERPVEALRHVESDELISRLTQVLSAVEAGAVFEVSAVPSSFILGPPSIGRAFALYDDKEYGWPQPIEADEVRSIEDVMPRHRRHPVVERNGKPIAMSISRGEYEDLLAQS
jgi:hypothetical protein